MVVAHVERRRCLCRFALSFTCDCPLPCPPRFFSLPPCPHLGWGMAEGRKNVAPLHRLSPASGHVDRFRSLAASLGVANAATTFYPCQPSCRPVTTHCLRPQASRGSLGRAHPSEARFPCGITRLVCGGPLPSLVTGLDRLLFRIPSFSPLCLPSCPDATRPSHAHRYPFVPRHLHFP